MMKRYKFYFFCIAMCMVAALGLLFVIAPWVWVPDVFRGPIVVSSLVDGDVSYHVVQEWSDDFYWSILVVIVGVQSYYYVIDPDGNKLWGFQTEITLSKNHDSVIVSHRGVTKGQYDLGEVDMVVQFLRSNTAINPPPPRILAAIRNQN